MTNRTEIIKELVAKIDNSTVMLDRQTKLLALVDKYGYDDVSTASGWSVSTIIQYCKSSSPIIGLERLSQADTVLKQL